MITLDLSVTISEQNMGRLVAAARHVFGNEAMTEAEVTEAVRQHGIGLIKQMIKQYERGVAVAWAEGLDPDIEVV